MFINLKEKKILQYKLYKMWMGTFLVKGQVCNLKIDGLIDFSKELITFGVNTDFRS